MHHVTHAVPIALQVDRNALHPLVLKSATMAFHSFVFLLRVRTGSEHAIVESKLESRSLIFYLLFASSVNQQNQS